MSQPPVRFSEKVGLSKSANGYPVQISASDLDRNFYYATLNLDPVVSGSPQPWLVNELTGPGGQKVRQLVFNPPPPLDGKTYVLGFSGGNFTWLPTEEC